MTHIDEAQRHLRDGRTAKARSRLECALAENADDTRALRMLAQIAFSERAFERAEELLEQLISLEPGRGIHHRELAIVCLERNRLDRALAELETAGRADPDEPLMLAYKGVALERLGRRYDAAMAFHRLWSRTLQGGRLISALPPPIQALATRGRHLVQEETAALLDEALAETRLRFGGADASRLEQFVRITLGETRAPARHALKHAAGVHFPGLPERPFHDRAQFDWIEDVESQVERIRDEYLALGEDDAIFKPYVSLDEKTPAAEHWKNVNNSRAWNSFHLYRYGELQEEAARRCPVTLQALEHAPLSRVRGHGPESIFSVLKPKTHIPPHHGLVGGRLLVHLPLIVPEKCGALRVGGEQRSWEVGRCLVFDDTFRHEAWNNSNETRVVLIFDIWHPQLSDAEIHGFSEVLRILDQINLDSLGRRMLRQ